LRHQYQNVHAGIWRRAKPAPDSPLVRHRATSRCIRPGACLFIIANPPAMRIGQRQAWLKMGSVGRLHIARSIRCHTRVVANLVGLGRSAVNLSRFGLSTPTPFTA
jgi:hypothetical protein